jgi:hypothetical protein
MIKTTRFSKFYDFNSNFIFYEEKNTNSFIELDWFVHVFDKPLENYVVCPLYNDSDVSKIQNIETDCHEHITQHGFHNHRFDSQVVFDKIANSNQINLHKTIDPTLFFNKNRKQIKKLQIPTKRKIYVRLILTLSHVIINNFNKHCSCFFRIVQMQFLENSTKSFPHYQNCMFGHNDPPSVSPLTPSLISSNKSSDSKISTLKAKDHKIYGQYMKMLDLGVPKVAVEQKLRIDNHDIAIANIQPNDPMPNEWMNSHLQKSVDKSDSQTLKLDFNSVKLQKTEKIEKKKSNHYSFGFTISIDQIQKAISKLRKTSFF